MSSKFLSIRSDKFGILPGEEDEIVNDGMYGKALASYLQEQLLARGYDAPFTCAEDWGWWVELKGVPFTFGVCVYCLSDQESPREFAISDGALVGRRVFSFRKFRFIPTAPYIEKLYEDFQAIFDDDPEVEFLGISTDFPG